MNWSEFFRAIDAGAVPPVCLFTGPEVYVKREALDRLRSKLPPGLEALNESVLEGVTAQQIIDAAETLPMMCERRIVVVRDWAPLLSGKSKNEEEEVKRLEAWLDDPPTSCALIFDLRVEPDSRKKMTGILRKKAEVVSFDWLTDAELSKWAAARLKAQGKRVSRQAMTELTFMAGRELTRLSGELDKLAAYLGEGRAEITPEDVRAIVSASLEYNTYELIGHLLAGDVFRAQQLVNSLMQGGQNAVGILAMLTRQVRQLTHMKCALEAGGTVQQVQEQLKMHPYAAKQTARQCASLSAKWLTGLYERCVAADFAVKSGRLRDRDALDSIVFQIGLASKRN